ncbi:MAG: laccase domain-containing protein, partial [Fermentimonas sp.]|nr:laccase domain-containing protein [Fermentimonas sp.]
MKKHPQYNNLLLFELLDKEKDIIHFSTTRVGGVSNGTYSSFNMGNFSDDSPLNIHENRNILARMFYMNTDKFIIPHQTHGTRVLKIDEEFMDLDSASAIEIMYGVDATVSNLKGLFLCATTADCVPIIIY